MQIGLSIFPTTYSIHPVRLAKEAVLKSFDTTIEGGLEFERKNFYLLFASEDQKEGMKAFVEKRPAEWRGR